MNIFIPQWQGAGNSDFIYASALKVRKLLSNLKFIEPKSMINTSSPTRNNIQNYDVLLSNLNSIKETIEKQKPKNLFTLGGDCSVDIIPINYLNKKYSGDLSIIWIDAHADLNTPQSSPSKTLHGMPLGILLGDGDEEFIKLTFSKINTTNIFFAGLRDTDPPEEEYIKQNKISVISCTELEDNFDSTLRSLGRLTSNNIYVHIDMDVLDPTEFSEVMCPTVNGITKDTLVKLIAYLTKHKNIAGGSVLEYTTTNPQDLKWIAKLFLKLTGDSRLTSLEIVS